MHCKTKGVPGGSPFVVYTCSYFGGGQKHFRYVFASYFLYVKVPPDRKATE